MLGEIYTCRTWRNGLKIGEACALGILALPFHVIATAWLHHVVVGPLLSTLRPATAHEVSRVLFWAMLVWSIVSLAEPSPRQWLQFRIEVVRDGFWYSVPTLWTVQRGFASWDEVSSAQQKPSGTVLQVKEQSLVIPKFVDRYERLIEIFRERVPQKLAVTAVEAADAQLRRKVPIDDSLLKDVHTLTKSGHKTQAITLLQEKTGVDLHTAFDYVHSWADEQEHATAPDKAPREPQEQASPLPLAQSLLWKEWHVPETVRSILIIIMALGFVVFVLFALRLI